MENEQITPTEALEREYKDKIIDFVLTIPIEKWENLKTEVNGIRISINEDAYRNPIVILKNIVLIKEIIIYPRQDRNLLVSDFKIKLKKIQNELDVKKNKDELERIYDILNCKSNDEKSKIKDDSHPCCCNKPSFFAIGDNKVSDMCGMCHGIIQESKRPSNLNFIK